MTKNVKVLLRDNVDDLGEIGDVVAVSPGFARNYLFPRRLAVEASEENVRMLQRKRARFEAETAAREAEVGTMIETLGRIVLRTTEKADENGTLYGSVSAARVAELLGKAGHRIDERNVRLDEPIKSVGTHEVPIHVWGEHYAGIQIVVEAE